ncbi:MAG: DUF1566 domain-containing protein [Nitrospira sp.]|nr:DUF1566 domain-containing protein [Nitrospira sp.]
MMSRTRGRILELQKMFLRAILMCLVLFGLVAPALVQAVDLTISFTGTGTGRVEGSDVPGTGPFFIFNTQTISFNGLDPLPSITLTAIPTGLGADQSEFSGWNGCTSTTANLCTVILDAAKTVTVTFNLVPENQAPTVDAGLDQTIAFPDSVLLNGTVNDDGLPDPGTLTILWEKVSGPGDVNFINAASEDTTAKFSAPGVYMLRLTANDGGKSDQDDVEITVTVVDLEGVTQNWDKKLDSTNGDANGCNSDRFTCLFGDTVVRDNETGLVWERDPDTGVRTWIHAISHCARREVGGRKGFHLPMLEQLATLVDSSNSDPTLPTGHPFLNVQSAEYWSATTDAGDPADAWVVGFGSGSMDVKGKANGVIHAWCARGGQAYDGQDVQSVIEALPGS